MAVAVIAVRESSKILPKKTQVHSEPMNVIGMSGLQNSVLFKKRELPCLSPRHYRIVQGLDSAAVLLTHQGVVAAAEEERFSREKGTGAFPSLSIQYCLREGGLKLSDIDYIAHGFCTSRFDLCLKTAGSIF